MRKGRPFSYLLLFFIFILATVFTPDKDLDLFRYYEEAESMNLDLSIKEIIENYLNNSFDFIYYLILFVFRVLHIPLHLVNGLFVTFFYYSAFRILDDYSNYDKSVTTKNIQLAMLTMVFAMPLTFVFSIARMTASLSFLFWGIHKLLNKKFVFACLLLIISFFTHSGISIIILFFSIAFVIGFVVSRRKSLQKHSIFFVFILSSVSFFLLKYGIELLLQASFFETYHYFANYLEEVSKADFEGLGRITTITFIYYFFCMLVCSWRAELSFPYNTAIFILIFMIVSYFLNDMFLQRMSMFSIPFFGVLMLSSSKKIGWAQTTLTYIAIFLGCSCLVATHRFYLL